MTHTASAATQHPSSAVDRPTITVRATVTRPVLITDTVTVEVPADIAPTELHSEVLLAANGGEGDWRGDHVLTYGDEAWELDTPIVTVLEAAMPALLRCPTSATDTNGAPHTVIGCGAVVPDERDSDGLVDCPHCGICFDPTNPTNTSTPTSTGDNR